MNVLITGAEGFIGRNLVAHLRAAFSWTIAAVDRANSWSEVEEAAAGADFVVHLAGINRPLTDDEFQSGNVDLTQKICELLLTSGRPTPFILSSSIQAVLDNPYGVSKRQAEDIVSRYAEQSGAPVLIYRLKNVFGKWCRPNYNSVTATFCYNIARDLPITVSDPNRQLDLVYIDDVVKAITEELTSAQFSGVQYRDVQPSYQITLQELAALITSFRQVRQTLVLPGMDDEFTRRLYATYLTYLPTDNFAYNLDKKCDPRGCLAEFLKSPTFGQLFVSRTHPGITAAITIIILRQRSSSFSKDKRAFDFDT